MRMVIKTYVIKSRPGTHEEVELASLSKRVKKNGQRVVDEGWSVVLYYGQCFFDEGLGGFVHHLRPPGTSWRCLDQRPATRSLEPDRSDNIADTSRPGHLSFKNIC